MKIINLSDKKNSAKKPCFRCNGTKEIPCENCVGKKSWVACQACNGRRKMICPQCHGKGYEN